MLLIRLDTEGARPGGAARDGDPTATHCGDRGYYRRPRLRRWSNCWSIERGESGKRGVHLQGARQRTRHLGRAATTERKRRRTSSGRGVSRLANGHFSTGFLLLLADHTPAHTHEPSAWESRPSNTTFIRAPASTLAPCVDAGHRVACCGTLDVVCHVSVRKMCKLWWERKCVMWGA